MVKKISNVASKGKKVKKETKRGAAQPLSPNTSSDSLLNLVSLSNKEVWTLINDLFRRVVGASPTFFSGEGLTAPRAASTSTDRAGAAADLATIIDIKGLVFVLKKCSILVKVEQNLCPNGIQSLFGNGKGLNPGGGMRKIASSVSLSSMASIHSDNIDLSSTIVSDSKRGKTIPPEAREGCLLFLRALVEIVGTSSEPFVVPLLAAALEECSSSSNFVRNAAEDTASSIISIVSCHALPNLVCPVIFEALHSPEWRVKTVALQKLAECADLHPHNISRLLPKILPIITSQVWDTKPQVTNAAKKCILACCMTNINPDVAPAIPAIVTAICKPNETSNAIDELKATTFVAPVDASTLSILCPVLSRGLKEKVALSKRSCCIVIENMSKLVETPEAVKPFGPLLVPELKKVAENVQFEEIRDAALAGLSALTKALGHSSIDDAVSYMMKAENDRIATEQQRIEEERAARKLVDEVLLKKEEDERKQWKEAMEAQRLLNELVLREEEEKKADERRKKELAKKSTKGEGGKCQSCGLKKCKKTCLFKK